MSPTANKICIIAALLILLTVSAFIYRKPYYNWDIFPYMALAARDASIPFDSTHAHIYKDAALNMPPHDFEAISQREPVLRSSPREFESILKYFEIKPGYNFVVRVIHLSGLNLLASTYLPSVISYFLIGCLMLVWLQKIAPLPYSAAAALTIMASPFLITTARFSSPDMLCAIFSFAGLFIMLESSVIIGLITGLIAITMRPDALVLYLFIVFAVRRSGKLTLATASTFRVLAVLVTIFTLKDPAILMEFLVTTSQGPGGLIQNYGNSLLSGLSSLAGSGIILFTLISIITLFLMYKSGVDLLKNVWALLLSGVIGTFIVRYLLHPAVEDRFLVACYLVVIVGFCREISRRFPVNTFPAD